MAKINMQVIQKPCINSLKYLGILLLLYSCCGCPPPPINPYYPVDTYYRTEGGADLLKASTTNSFRQKDIRITTKIMTNEGTKELDYYKDHTSDGIVKIYSGKYDDPKDTAGNHILIYLPNGSLKPMETYVRLSSTVIDTITYTFGSAGNNQFFPEKLFYNKKMIWDFSKSVQPVVTIVK